MYKIAIDVGGTNTDAVIVDYDGAIIAKVKANTTLDIQSGIENAINQLIQTTEVESSKIKFAMLGTTQCTNAIVERRKLKPVTAIRLASHATHAIKQYCSWPADLRAVVEENSFIIDGGFEYDGRPIRTVVKEQVLDIVKQTEVHNYAIAGVFSPLDKTQEEQVKKWILELVPTANVSVSHEIGSLSLLERENATILNSSLQAVIKLVADGFQQALRSHGINQAIPYICQNDGTIMNLEYACSHPILTIASGPTNSIRGGGYLSACSDALIIDVGGTTTDIGAITKGLARESQGTTKIGGVESNFRMPDMISVGLGGGTVVKINGEQITVGPESVGYQLTSKALCFGGDTLTLSDVAKVLGRSKLGTHDVALDLETAKRVDSIVNQMISSACMQMKLDENPIDIILVGGGTHIINPYAFTHDNLLLPEHSEVANAIGASIAQTSGGYEALVAMKGKDKQQVVDEAIAKAKASSVASGADPETIEVVEILKSPLSYHPEEAYVLKIKVIGDLLFAK